MWFNVRQPRSTAFNIRFRDSVFFESLDISPYTWYRPCPCLYTTRYNLVNFENELKQHLAAQQHTKINITDDYNIYKADMLRFYVRSNAAIESSHSLEHEPKI